MMKRLGVLVGFGIVVFAQPGCTQQGESEEASSSDALASDGAYEKTKRALDTLDSLDARLGRELADLAPGLTDKDVANYTYQFRHASSYVKAQDELRTASDDLASALRRSVADLENIARTQQRPRAAVLPAPGEHPPPTTPLPALGVIDATEPVFTQFAVLTRTSHAADAVAFAAHCIAGDTELGRQLVSVDNPYRLSKQRLVDELLVPALLRAVAESVSHAADVADALAAFKSSVGGVQGATAKVIDLVDAVAENKVHLADIESAIIADSDEETRRAFALKNTKLGRTVTAIGVLLTLVSLGDQATAANGDILQLTKAAMDGFGALADGIQLGRRTVLGLDEHPGVAAVGKAVGKLGAGLGVLLSSEDIIAQFLAWKGSGSQILTVAGDVLGIAGGVIALAGVSGPIGPAIAAVGFVVAMFATMLADEEKMEAERTARRDDVQWILPKIGFTTDEADTYANADPFMMRQLEGALGFSPIRVRAISDIDPYTVRADYLADVKSYVVLQRASCAFHLTGDQGYALLYAVSAGQEKPAFRVESFLRYLQDEQYAFPRQNDFDAWLTRFDVISRGLAYDPPIARSLFANAAQYVRQHETTLRAQAPSTERCR